MQTDAELIDALRACRWILAQKVDAALGTNAKQADLLNEAVAKMRSMVAGWDALIAEWQAEPSPEWIAVTDRLPALDRIVPVRTQWGIEYAQRGQDTDDSWLWADQTGEAETCADRTISHWFDLPAAPEASNV